MFVFRRVVKRQEKVWQKSETVPELSSVLPQVLGSWPGVLMSSCHHNFTCCWPSNPTWFWIYRALLSHLNTQAELLLVTRGYLCFYVYIVGHNLLPVWRPVSELFTVYSRAKHNFPNTTSVHWSRTTQGQIRSQAHSPGDCTGLRSLVVCFQRRYVGMWSNLKVTDCNIYIKYMYIGPSTLKYHAVRF